MRIKLTYPVPKHDADAEQQWEERTLNAQAIIDLNTSIVILPSGDNIPETNNPITLLKDNMIIFPEIHIIELNKDNIVGVD